MSGMYLRNKMVKGLAFGLAFASPLLADNPISSYHYLADPGAAADDENFYIVTDSDDPAPFDAKGYNIKALYVFSSKDMKNWTDYGIIYEAKREANYVNDIWASGIAVRGGKFYIIFPNGASGVGLIKADRPEGPWTNAVAGHNMLVGNGGVIGCDGVAWCFDPAIFFDDDGTGWITFGGGEGATRPNTDNFDIAKLTDNADGIVDGTLAHVKVNNLPTRKMLEASYIHKHNKMYYFSYSTGWQQGAPSIDYAMSDKVTGPYTWKGTILEDPAINGKSINGNNNHHGIAEFKGHSYVVYHDRRIANGYGGLEVIPAMDGKPNPNGGFHRSVGIDEMFYNADGTIKKVVCTVDGPEQIENFDPYKIYPALTSSLQKGVRSRTDYTANQPIQHILTPLASRAESYIRVSGVDFGKGATKFIVEAASVADGNKIELHTGTYNGPLAGTCTLKNTGNWKSYVENECEVSGLENVVKSLFMVFKGSKDSTMGIRSWTFEGSGTTPPTPQTAFEGDTAKVPGIIEAERFDVSGSRDKSYYDADAENQGDADFRTEEGVDIVKGGTGMAIGYTNAGEWLEYTINVTDDSDKSFVISAATGSAETSVQLFIDDKAVTDTVKITQTDPDSWDVYKEFSGTLKSLSKGVHTLKLLITGNFVNIDYIAIGKSPTTRLASAVKPAFNQEGSFKVFDVNGICLGKVQLKSVSEASSMVKALTGRSGIYVLKKGSRSMMVNVK